MTIITGTINWWMSLNRTVKIIGAVGVISGAVYSVAQAWPLVEPFWYAHRGYVRWYDDEHLSNVLHRLNKIQLVQDEDRRQRLLDEAAKREIELQGDQAKQLPQYRDLVQDRVNRIKSELKTLEEQDSNLFTEKKALGGR
jgi:hypothetical protein